MKNIILLIGIIFLFLIAGEAKAYYACSEYGIGAYSDGLGYCKCMSGYMWDTDYFGNKTCVSGITYCYNNYGINSTYDYLSSGCKCRSGYF